MLLRLKMILEQWEAICYFISELVKEPKKMPNSINFRRLYSMLGTNEKAVTRVLLEFFSSVISVFEEFLLLLQRSSPVVHILYDCIC